jgi:hypothetical protein
MGGVQETLFDKVLTGGRGSPKIQYSKSQRLCESSIAQKRKNILWETDSQSSEKKAACDKIVCRAYTTVAPAFAYQRLGCS